MSSLQNSQRIAGFIIIGIMISVLSFCVSIALFVEFGLHTRLMHLQIGPGTHPLDPYWGFAWFGSLVISCCVFLFVVRRGVRFVREGTPKFPVW
jgi:hypothetical protein